MVRHRSVDVQNRWFVAAEVAGSIHLQELSSSEPFCTIQMSEIERQQEIRVLHSKSRGIRAISFDHVFDDTFFGVMTTELCCVFDVRTPTAPVNVLSTQFCRPSTRSNTPTVFRSFAFCGNGCVLVLTDKDIFRWSYLQATCTPLQSLYHQSKRASFRKIEFKSTSSLIGSFSRLP